MTICNIFSLSNVGTEFDKILPVQFFTTERVTFLPYVYFLFYNPACLGHFWAKIWEMYWRMLRMLVWLFFEVSQDVKPTGKVESYTYRYILD